MSTPENPPADRIDIAMVRHIATLARLGLTDDQAEAFSRQLSTILEYVNHLAEVDIEGVEPAAAAPGTRETLRPDEAGDSLPREDFLAIVPRQAGGQVRVPPVFGGE